jgi:hypothetical protein
MSAVTKIPFELWRIILNDATPYHLLPPEADDLINNIKLLADDCELAAAHAQYRTGLRTMCKVWKQAIDDLPHPFLLLPDSTSELPCAFRVQLPTSCECRKRGCPMEKPPPLTSYKTGNRPMEAFLDASTRSERDIMRIIANHTELWLLSIAVDFSFFSLPVLSSTCRRLTHLSFSEFNLLDCAQDQTLDLPQLNTLILNFFSPGQIPQPVHLTQIHRAYKDWRLPRLRNLSLKGWVSDDDPRFLDEINEILHNVGRTLRGLLYKLWRLPDRGVDSLYLLPTPLWDWCPYLHTIQTALKILLAASIPPASHPRLTFVPVHLGDLDSLPNYVSQIIWPGGLFQEFQNSAPWPIDIIRISTTWATFHRKLRRLHQRPTNPNQEGQPDEPPTDWPRYFCDWANVLLSKGYTIEDRNHVSVLEGRGEALLSWLRGINDWYFIDGGETEVTGQGQGTVDQDMAMEDVTDQ